MDRFPSVTGPAPLHQTARRVYNPVQVTSLGIRRGAEGKRGARTRPATCAERAICKLCLHFKRLVSPRRASRFSAVSRPAQAAGQPDLAASAVVEWCCWAGLSVCGVASSTASSTASSRTSDIAREMSTREGVEERQASAKHKRARHAIKRGSRGRGGAETGRRSGGGRTEGLGGAARSSRAPAAATCRQGARLSLGGFKPLKRARLANDYKAPENGTFVGVT